MSSVHRLFTLLLFTSLMHGVPAFGQESSKEEDIRKTVQRVQQELHGLETLSAQIAVAPEHERPALVYRRDERSMRFLRDINRWVESVVALDSAAPEKAPAIDRLKPVLDAAAQGVMQRIKEIDGRIASLRSELDEQSGAQLVTGEAFLQSLQGLRLRFYEALVALIEAKAALGLPEQGLQEQFSPQLHLLAEAMSGRIEFTGGALKELRQRKKGEPGNADLDQAIADLARQQSMDLAHLDTIINLLRRLDEDPVSYRSVLLEQGQGLSVSTFESGAIGGLLEDGWSSLKQAIADEAPDLVLNLIIFLIILLAFRSLSKLARTGVRAACERPGVDISTLLKDVLVSVCGGTVMVMGVLIALSQIGISLGPMLAGLGVAGFVIGFALQDTLANFAAGGMILAYRPYDVDDFIEVAGASGLVKKMSLVSTTITTFDNQTLVVPNSKIWGDVIKNVTAQKVRRVDLVFGIGYGDDIEHAERILKEVVEAHEQVLDRPETMIKVHELGDSSVNFVVRPWVRTEDYWNVYWDLTREVKLRFDRESISIPFPQRDVHIYREEG